MENFLRIILICILFFIFLQDFRDRLVIWFLYPLAGILAMAIQCIAIGPEMAFFNVGINMVFISVVLIILLLFTRFVMKKKLVGESMGIGDVLLFAAICFTFSPLPFIVFYVFSIFFSLLLHLAIQYFRPQQDVPLAGYMSLFFSFIYLADMVPGSNLSLY